jgi:ankyrin repeat protein
LLTGLTVSYRRARIRDLSNELIESSWRGNAPKVQELLAAGADVNFNLTAHPSCIPLTCAAQQGHAEIVRLLLDSGADVSARDDSHMTALQWAREKGHGDVVSMLKGAGAKE